MNANTVPQETAKPVEQRPAYNRFGRVFGKRS